MDDILYPMNNATYFVVLPALGIASVFYCVNVRTKASLLLALGFLLVALGPLAAFVFPDSTCARNDGEYVDEAFLVDPYWDDGMGDAFELSSGTVTELNYVQNFMMDAGYLLLFIGLSMMTFAKMRRKKSATMD